ncbi:ROK family transcriptional regulator [soil metagenome]|jgi:predicted NBD/HSP70 family sugar kinase
MAVGEGMSSQAVDVRWMRLANLSLVLTTIIRHAPVSQSLLIDLTGLKKPTISNLVDELARLGWVRVEGAVRNKIGRPRQLLAPNPGRGLIVSAQISIDRLATLIVDFSGTERARGISTVDVSRISQSETVGRLAHLVRDGLRDAGAAPGGVLATALGLPGIVGEHGDVVYVPGLAWDTADVGGMLRSALADVVATDVPLLVENEANLATVSEQRPQACRDVHNFVYLLGEAGVGAGVVIDGALFRGTRGAAGEIGHVSIALDGPRCSCGKRGCWALYVGREALLTAVRPGRAGGRGSSLWNAGSGHGGEPDPLTPERIVAAARAGDAVAAEALGLLRRYLAAGIGNIASAYDPEVVVLGGFLATAFAQDLDALQSEVDAWLMGDLYDGLRVELSTHGHDAPLWGGVALALHHLAANPRAVDPLPATG